MTDTMNIRAMIFDLDGTLIDSLEDIADSMNRVLVSMHYPIHDLEAYRYFIGDGVRLLVQRALPEPHNQNDEMVAHVLSAYRKDYLQHWSIKTKPYDGIPEVLRTLAENRIPLGVLSNKPDAVTKRCVAHFFPDIAFVQVAGQREDVPRKPDPTAAIAIASAMKTDPSACAFIGDTATDMQTAKAAGMFPVGVTWGFRPAEEMLDNGARMLAYRPSLIAQLIAG